MPSTTNFGIIKKLKSIVRKTGNVFFWSGRDKGITEEIARKIQRTAYEVSQTHHKETFTPPYKEIAKQLQVQDETIYRAAIYRLTDIAVNEDRMALDILEMLEQEVKKTSKNKDLQEYIQQKIDFIKQVRKVKP